MGARYLVSACLAGEKCRYDGSSCAHQRVVELVLRGEAIPFCPEVAGGLGIPRERCEICLSADLLIRSDLLIRVITQSGRDVTYHFLKGAEETLRRVHDNKIECAIMKSLSPSCGFGRIYDGSFSGRLVNGKGVAAALLYAHGVKILSEKEADVLPL
ncbi:MAG: hypothetical protein AMS17_00930 [Spirochaetes bacterium DG_61]|jgi:uncharacterized protein YbbK (DUF523 family)|nr:MAG: hypothetical protein AMS17_00930 [Spirochaetes bacterium DG_61]